MKIIHPRKVQGQTISTIYDCDNHWKEYDTQSVVPNNYKLFNFYVSSSELNLLVLDPYGDETICSKKIRNRLFGEDPFTVGINTDDGTIYSTVFYKESDKFSIGISKFGLLAGEVSDESFKLPPEYLKQLDLLKSMKRPFDIQCRPFALINFIDREYGYDHLRNELMIQFDFRPKLVEVCKTMWRETTVWK